MLAARPQTRTWSEGRHGEALSGEARILVKLDVHNAVSALTLRLAGFLEDLRSANARFRVQWVDRNEVRRFGKSETLSGTSARARVPQHGRNHYRRWFEGARLERRERGAPR